MPQFKNVCITSFNMDIDWNNIDIKALDKKQSIKYIILQGEFCKDKKKHIQGFIQFHNKKELTFIKKLLQDNTLHIEQMRGTPKQARDYCSDLYTDENGQQKDIWMNQIEYGELDETTQGVGQGLLDIRNRINNGESLKQISYTATDEKTLRYTLMYNKALTELERNVRHQSMKDKLQKQYEDVVWNKLQTKLLNILKEEPDKRKVHWVYDEVGNSGKSFLAKYLSITQDTFYTTGGKITDNQFAYNGERNVIIDLARTNVDNLDHIYTIIEQFKNGHYLSTKYQSETKIFEIPHIIVMANFKPDTDKLSKDRWDIINTAEQQETIEILEESSDEPCKPSSCIPYKIDRNKKHKHTTLNQERKKLKKKPPTPNAIRSDYSDSDEYEQDIRKMENHNQYILKEIERQKKSVKNLY